MAFDRCWNDSDKELVLDYVKPNLWRYLFNEALPNLESSIKDLIGLSNEELEVLKVTHFLLSPEVKELIEIVPQLMRNLAHSTQKEIVEYNGIVKGRIDWNLTFKERYSRGYNDPSLFICRPASKMYDLPENQLLKFILWKIRKLSENIDILPNISDEILEKDKTNYWLKLILERYLEVRRTLKHVYFQNISIPRTIHSKDIQKVNNSRNKLYKKVVTCYNLYDGIFRENNMEMLKDLLEKQILEPLNNDKLFEIYVLFKTIDFFDHLNGNLKMGLLKPGLDYIARYDSENLKACIFYQRMPPIFSQNSKNKDIFDLYDLNAGLRRPDLILEIETKERKLYYIIEVKRTQKRDYIVDSVYKVLGYLSDFENCFDSEKHPQGILVVWDKINVLEWDKAFENPVVILKHDNFDKGLKMIISG